MIQESVNAWEKSSYPTENIWGSFDNKLSEKLLGKSRIYIRNTISK